MIDQAGSITRAEIARLQHLDRSTLTRNLKLILCEGWIEEIRDNGRRPEQTDCVDGRRKGSALQRSAGVAGGASRGQGAARQRGHAGADQYCRSHYASGRAIFRTAVRGAGQFS
ncbi:hypothetical protein HAP47_0006015 [Bradyrhizobium sp. 41S5]|uniref:hypothetical protein n=1 Tax=Bradyrhizobium sp. 41S5 TaxID=1404443 RepID=UPI00205EA182|nr:hypothetical protein HAP47_0006015 [Bradyrhizobium sp. 41S5]